MKKSKLNFLLIDWVLILNAIQNIKLVFWLNRHGENFIGA
jgi:hypothetical protein